MPTAPDHYVMMTMQISDVHFPLYFIMAVNHGNQFYSREIESVQSIDHCEVTSLCAKRWVRRKLRLSRCGDSENELPPCLNCD